MRRLAAAWMVLMLSTPALAKPAKLKNTPPPVVFPPPVVTPDLVQSLESNDEAAAIAAAKKLGESNAPADAGPVVDALTGALAHGAPPAVTVALVQALGGKNDPRAVAALERHTRHRSPAVRKAALTALAALPAGDKRALPPLLTALGDSDGETRAVAAKLIGDRREHGAEERLIKLLEHRDASAAGALAAIGTPELAHRLSEMMGSVPDPILCSALGEMLKRRDFGPEAIRVELVRTLGKVPGPDATTALIEYVAATESDKARPSRQEAQKLVDERGKQ